MLNKHFPSSNWNTRLQTAMRLCQEISHHARPPQDVDILAVLAVLDFQITCFRPVNNNFVIPEDCSPSTKAMDKTITSGKTLGTGTRASKIENGENNRCPHRPTTTSLGALLHAKVSHWQTATTESFNFNNHAVSKKLDHSIPDWDSRSLWGY